MDADKMEEQTTQDAKLNTLKKARASAFPHRARRADCRGLRMQLGE